MCVFGSPPLPSLPFLLPPRRSASPLDTGLEQLPHSLSRHEADLQPRPQPDTTHVLLPRATGLFHTLTALSSAPGAPFPSLTLYDLTIGYAGVPAQGYAQDYYRLQTLFGFRVPPPTVHLHVRRARAAQDVPLEDRADFDKWLRQRWDDKDRLMAHFGEHGRFEGAEGVRDERAELDIRLRAVDFARMGACVATVFVAGRVLWWAWSALRSVKGG